MKTKLTRGSYPTAEQHYCGQRIYLVVGWWDDPVRYCPNPYCGYIDGTPTEFPDVIIQHFSLGGIFLGGKL